MRNTTFLNVTITVPDTHPITAYDQLCATLPPAWHLTTDRYEVEEHYTGAVTQQGDTGELFPCDQCGTDETPRCADLGCATRNDEQCEFGL